MRSVSKDHYMATVRKIEDAFPFWDNPETLCEVQDALQILIQWEGLYWLEEHPELREPPEQLLHAAGFRSQLHPKVFVSYCGRDLWFTIDSARALIRACERPIQVFFCD